MLYFYLIRYFRKLIVQNPKITSTTYRQMALSLHKSLSSPPLFLRKKSSQYISKKLSGYRFTNKRLQDFVINFVIAPFLNQEFDTKKKFCVPQDREAPYIFIGILCLSEEILFKIFLVINFYLSRFVWELKTVCIMCLRLCYKLASFSRSFLISRAKVIEYSLSL